MIPFDELSDEQFEALVVEIARKNFGIGVQGFTKGRDGGRDARFLGVAERFPSQADPWRGTTIIQAKHDNGLNGSFAENKFSGHIESSVITEELIRLRLLRAAKDLDNYLLVSNRRLPGGVNTAICQRIADELQIDPRSVHLMGLGDIESHVRMFPDVVDLARIRWADAPLMVSSEDICAVVLAIADALSAPAYDSDNPVTSRVPYDKKNELNRMSDTFAADLERRYLKYSHTIQEFLQNPQNYEVQERYADAVDEFKLKIPSMRQQFDSFDQVFIYITDLLTRRDPVLASRVSSRLVRAVIFHMYWFCDIGRTSEEEAEWVQ